MEQAAFTIDLFIRTGDPVKMAYSNNFTLTAYPGNIRAFHSKSYRAAATLEAMQRLCSEEYIKPASQQNPADTK